MARDGTLTIAAAPQPSSSFGYFRLQSRVPAERSLSRTGGTVVCRVVAQWPPNSSPGSNSRTVPTNSTWLLDLQPGSNDHANPTSSRISGINAPVTFGFQAATRLTAALPEKLDAGLLAERLEARQKPQTARRSRRNSSTSTGRSSCGWVKSKKGGVCSGLWVASNATPSLPIKKGGAVRASPTPNAVSPWRIWSSRYCSPANR